ncbi:putative virulence-mediating protein VirC [Vibrio orientalis CIP 102891 = ATCC 33934]|uniref:diguanylate cyclase n=1 Tax=Vibrio orientalis CIP 102891 = ATCC 33934 TaxID=675816 RepID=C9QEK1_VIBOR|nr:tetratricopeptide repeat-containing diguanylate cyclase [Vibrio orientalis]EEX94474.1 putative virulence-mediating protein VirC [Vibrio orientalis CIP 102891 = ATCC 33934]EGU53975.1 putative virulence-mediating protein VirC [Vibrio orientalis CIP 102891 = ATCC 33934]
MKRYLSFVITYFALSASFSAQAACNVEPQYDFLYKQVESDERSMLNFYYHSLCRPGKVQLSEISLPRNASAQSTALYYFGLLNLKKYEGIAIDTPPDLVQFGQQAGIDWITAEAKLNKAIKLLESDQLSEGELLLHETVILAREIGYKRLLARAYRWLGNIKMQHSNIKASLNYYKMAFALVNEIGDDFQATMTLNNIATVYMQSEEWKQANINIKRALKLYQTNQYDNSLFEAILYANSSAIYFATGDHEQAATYMRLALQEADKTGSNRIKFSTLSNMSQLYSSVGRPTEALDMAQRCLDLSKQSSESPVMLATCYDSFSTAYLAQENYDQTIAYAHKSLDILAVSESQETAWELQLLANLVNAYEKQGNYQQALNYMKQSALLKQDFNRQTYNEEIISEKGALERTLNKREVELLEATNALQAAKLEEQRSKNILYTALFIFISYFAARVFLRLKRSNSELKQQNHTDLLTGAYNRRYLEQWIKQETLITSDVLVSVLDIDHFKSFNDQHGHDIGDMVLKETVQVLQGQLRKQDQLIRWGGEEFILLIPLDGHENVAGILERLRGCIESHHYAYGSQQFNVTISLGAKVCTGQILSKNWDENFAQIDAALYRAKSAGRNRYQIAV